MTDFIKQQQEEAELAVFWDEIAQNLPKSIERNALGDEKIFRAFATTYPKIKAQIIKNTFTEALRIIDEHDPNKSMARKTSSAYWGNTLRKEIEQIINTITHPTQ